MASAGTLRSRLRFEQRALDANQDRLGAWGEFAVMAAEIAPLRGGEPVMAQRLQGVQPVIVRVRASTASRSVDNSFRAVDVRSGQVYNITSATETPDRAWIEALATAKSGDQVAV